MSTSAVDVEIRVFVLLWRRAVGQNRVYWLEWRTRLTAGTSFIGLPANGMRPPSRLQRECTTTAVKRGGGVSGIVTSSSC